MEGKSKTSYGTYFEVVVYDTNMHLNSVVSQHSVGNESGETWDDAFGAAAAVPGFDRQGRTIAVDMEKSIGNSAQKIFTWARRFLDKRHAEKNMSPHLGAERSTGLKLYVSALYAPSREMASHFVAQMGPRQKAYLGNYEPHELYRAFSSIEDPVITSQGGESSMNAGLKNNIRNVEPMDMLANIVDSQFEKFQHSKTAALACVSPVPPRIEAIIGGLISKGKLYESVEPVPGTEQMQWHVRSLTNPETRRRVVMPTTAQTVPSCCAYSSDNSGFPCHHGVAVILLKHGACNVHKFVAKRHLTTTWQSFYRNIEYNLPHQGDIDKVVREAKEKVLSGAALMIPKALPPPRGRPVANAGIRKADWLEKGPASGNKRAYSCALCGNKGHTRAKCPSKQGGTGSSNAAAEAEDE